MIAALKEAGDFLTGRNGSRSTASEVGCVSQICRERLFHYAESFEELANSLAKEDRQEEQGRADKPEGSFATHKLDRREILDARRAMENRMLIRQNLNEMAQIMTSLAEELVQCRPLEESLGRMLKHALRAESIYAGYFCYLMGENDAKRSISMTLYTDKKGGLQAAKVADMLSVLLSHPLKLSVNSPELINERPRTFLFVDEPDYVVLTGFCKITKEEEKVSGDHYSILESEKGRITLLLSDGTGSGERASMDSERTLDLMEKFLEAGYEMEAAADMVNMAFFAGDGELSHPTLDSCELNLYDGVCSFFKVGGVASYIKRGDHVEKIATGTLPLGIFRNTQGTKTCRQLQDGDYVVMMTDGILEALSVDGYEELMEDTLAAMTSTGPGEIAERIMERALYFGEGHVRDDMTVLVAGIWDNKSV